MQTVGYLKQSAAGLLTGTSIANSTYPDTAIERAVRTVQTQAQIAESVQPYPITLYGGITEYLAPSTIFSDAIIDIRRQGLQNPFPRPTVKVRVKDFIANGWTLPSGYQVTFENRAGVSVMRISDNNAFPQTVIDSMGDASNWNASSVDVDNIENDGAFYYQYPSAVSFDILAAGTNGIYRDDLDNLDLSDYEGVGMAFIAFEVGSFADITGLSIRIGSDASNYQTFAATAAFLGAFAGGSYQIVAFNLQNPTSTTGTPDYADITYTAILVTTTDAVSDIHVGTFFVSLPSPHELLYATSAVFKSPTTGLLSKTVLSDGDIIIYNEAAFVLLEYQFALDLLLSNGGSIASGLAQNYHNKLYDKQDGLYLYYRAANPTQSLTTTGSYYVPHNN